MKRTIKIIILLSIIPLLIGIFFFSNIKGYYRFKHYCSTEGGLKIYEKLDRNVGWRAKDYNDAHVIAQLRGVGFVRYKDKEDGNNYDLRYLGGDPQNEKSFEKLPSDESKTIIYKWNYIYFQVPQERELGKFGYEIKSQKKDIVLARFYMFGYSKYEFLGRSVGVTCFDEEDGTINYVGRWFKELNTAFKN